MIYFILFLSLIPVFGYAEADIYNNKTICLNMIVKNERHVIEKCLASVKPFIDYWVIVDTGSTDGTQMFIKQLMSEIPGELYERPWINFCHNRNEALELAKNKSDYVFFIDADDTLTVTANFTLPLLEEDFYTFTINHSQMTYKRTQLINNRLDWKWVGVLHEYIYSPQAKSSKAVSGAVITYTGTGARSKDSEKFQKDAKILEEALLEEPHNSRYVFYLAQSYRDAQEYHKALCNYQKRIGMGGWDQEIFWSMLRVGLMQEELKMDSKIIIDSYTRASEYRPTRAEPLYRLANYYSRIGDYLNGYLIAKKGLNLKHPNDDCFVDAWVYDYGLLLEFSVCAYYIEQYAESFLASKLLLANPTLSPNIRTRVEQNLSWIIPKL